MGLWQNLVDSYDANVDTLQKAYPLSTTSISNIGDIIAIIVIDGNGNFICSDTIEKANNKKGIGTEAVIIPVTENSLGRSCGIAPHPVFDQYEYLKGEGKKYDKYFELLQGFAESPFATKPVRAIYQYIARRTVASDLSEMKLKDKTNIIFRVESPEHEQAKVWEDETFFNAWHQYYLDFRQNKEQLDYITGLTQPTATSHPKKISSASANSKLISEPSDDYFYTFRGKFSEASEALSIGYETSQKAHQFLRYLINDRGYTCGEQVILSFTIGSTEKLLQPPIKNESLCIYDLMQEDDHKTDREKQIDLRAATGGFDYADALKKSLAGFGYGKALEKHAKTAVLALDAATTGRLSITFYRELAQTEYIEKIADWHNKCKWNQKFLNKDKKDVSYISAPSVDKIIEAVYGKPRGGKDDKSFTKIKKAARERLLRCIFDGASLPRDYMEAARRRASNPLGFTNDNKFDRNSFEQVVSTACALIRKYYQQEPNYKEDYKLSIESDRTDRDYLYGRLLGAADKLEEYALRKKDNQRIVTAAIRHMQAFAQRPFRTWQTIHSCLNPYIQAVKGSIAFKEIEAIKNQFKPEDYEKDVPLNGSYLIGYYHERAYIYSLIAKAKAEKDKKQQSNINLETEDNNAGQ